MKRILMFVIGLDLVSCAMAPAVNEVVKVVEPPKEEDSVRLAKTFKTLVSLTKTDISPISQDLIGASSVRVAEKMFPTFEGKRTFLIVLAIESKFRRSAKSPAGAVGIGQVIPKYANEFAGKCGLGKIKEDDLYDTEINMMVSACQLKSLMDYYGGNMASVLVAYNAGSNSSAIKQLHSLDTISSSEAANYVTRYTYLRETLDQLERPVLVVSNFKD